MTKKKSTGSANVNVFDQIQSICNDFRRHLTRGESIQIEDYSGQLDDDASTMLFQNLLHIDIEFRRRSGEQPKSIDYIPRFPEFRRLIRQAFFEETMMSMDGGATPAATPVATPADGVTASLNQSGSYDSQELLEKPPAKRLGDYEIVREIGRGGFGVVYEARHLQQQHHVALKTLPTGIEGHSSPLNDAERLHKFRREFRSLAEVNHPHLVGMQTLEVDGSQWFFTMDLVAGTDFLDYVRPDDVLNERRLRTTLPQLASGIMALHGQHIVHRDLKPTNVLVSEDGRVVILDFGLVVEFDRRTDVTMSLQSQHFAGTPRYAAPEQIFGQRTAASDWYALGVMLYEALIGEPPYSAKSAAKLFLKKQNEDPPRLADRSDLPTDLAELADQLLVRDPEQRPDALTIAASLSVDLESHSSHESVEDSLSQSSSSSSASGLILIGRESQLAELEQFRRKLLQKRQPTTVFIRGRSGEGKTSLAEKFLAPHRLDTEMLVLSGRCYDRESVPFKAVDCIIDALVAFLRSRKANEVSKLLSEEIPFLSHLFPVLRRVEAIAQLPSGRIGELDSKQIRNRAFAALRDLLHRISQDTPIMMFIDDLQWGDIDSAEALSELLLDKQPPVMLFIGSYRSDEAKESPFLVQWHKSIDPAPTLLKGPEVLVGPLSREQCVELVITRIGIGDETIRNKAEELYQSTGGNPYFLDQLIECFDPDTGSFTPAPLNEVIDGRLKNLPAEAAKLLDVIAVSGQALTIGEASQAAGQGKPDVSTVTHMRNERLVRLIGSEEQQLVDTYHDKIRETVLDELPKIDRQELHLNIAQTFEQQHNISGEELSQTVNQEQLIDEPAPIEVPRVFDLAYHCYEANDSRAFIYQLLAAEAAQMACAMEDAMEHYEKAEKLSPELVSGKAQFRLWNGLASVHGSFRNTELAIEYLRKAINISPNKLCTSRAYYNIGTMQVYSGELSKARDSLETALAITGERIPKTNLGRFWSCIISSVQVFAIPARYQKAKTTIGILRARLRHEILLRLGSFTWEFSALGQSQCTLRQCVHALRNGNVDSISEGYALLSTSLAEFSLRKLARRCMNWSGQRISESHDVRLETRMCFFRGVYQYRSGQFHESLKQFHQSIEWGEEKRVAEDFEFALIFACSLHHFISSASDELGAALKLVEYANKTGNERGLHWGHASIANALGRLGRLNDMVPHLNELRDVPCVEKSLSSDAIWVGLVGRAYLHSSKYEQAEMMLEKSWAITERKRFYGSNFVNMLAHLLHSMLGPDWLTPSSNIDTKKLKRLCRKANWWSMLVHNEAANLQRAVGRGHLVLGRQKKAVRCLEKSVKLNRKLETRYPLALSLLDLAAIKDQGREQNRQEAIEILKQTESVIPHAEAWLLGNDPDMDCVAPPA